MPAGTIRFWQTEEPSEGPAKPRTVLFRQVRALFLCQESEPLQPVEHGRAADSEVMSHPDDIVHLQALGTGGYPSFNPRGRLFIEGVRPGPARQSLRQRTHVASHSLRGHQESGCVSVGPHLHQAGAVPGVAQDGLQFPVQEDMRVLMGEREAAAQNVVSPVRRHEDVGADADPSEGRRFRRPFQQEPC